MAEASERTINCTAVACCHGLPERMHSACPCTGPGCWALWVQACALELASMYALCARFPAALLRVAYLQKEGPRNRLGRCGAIDDAAAQDHVVRPPLLPARSGSAGCWLQHAGYSMLMHLQACSACSCETSGCQGTGCGMIETCCPGLIHRGQGTSAETHSASMQLHSKAQAGHACSSTTSANTHPPV